jgi:hypothetical protein
LSTIDLIKERASLLPGEFQQEHLRYVDYLVQRQKERLEGAEWSSFSAAQLSEQYAPSDAVYK